MRCAVDVLCKDTGLPRLSPGLWSWIRLRGEPLNMTFLWCPSHGKHQEWMVDDPNTARCYRKLNAWADQACTDAMEPFMEQHARFTAEYETAVK
eukprot:9946466-Alexandrium_andersonii.AAC.1